MFPQELIVALSYCPDTGIFKWTRTVGKSTPAGSTAGQIRDNRVYIGFKTKKYSAAKLAIYIAAKVLAQSVKYNDGNPLNLSINNLSYSEKDKPVKRLKRKVLEVSDLRDVLHYCPESGSFSWLSNINARARKGQKAGCIDSSSGYIRIAYKYKCYAAHQLAWYMFYGEWPSSAIDHINGCKSDNRVCNLRLVSSSQNAQNKYSAKRRSRLGYENITQLKNGLYRVYIRLEGATAHYSEHPSLEEAIVVRDQVKPLVHPFHPSNNV